MKTTINIISTIILYIGAFLMGSEWKPVSRYVNINKESVVNVLQENKDCVAQGGTFNTFEPYQTFKEVDLNGAPINGVDDASFSIELSCHKSWDEGKKHIDEEIFDKRIPLIATPNIIKIK